MATGDEAAPPSAWIPRGPAGIRDGQLLAQPRLTLPALSPTTVGAGRWELRAGSEVLRDFGNDRGASLEAIRLIKELKVNQLGRVPGSVPPFEYWLVEGKAPRLVNSRAVVLGVAGRNVRAEQVVGTWMVTDGSKGLYDFGKDEAAAKRAAAIFRKHGFNQVGGDMLE